MSKHFLFLILMASGLSGHAQRIGYKINPASFSNSGINYITGPVSVQLTYNKQDSLKNTSKKSDILTDDQIFSYYPNPVLDKLFIRYKKEVPQRLEIEVYNTAGQLVIRQFLQEKNFIDLSRLPKGTYIVIPKTEGATPFKIIKK